MLTFVGYIFKYIFTAIYYFLYYTLPLFMLFFGLFYGGMAGANINENKYFDWNDEKINEASHTVTIHWGYGIPNTTITVREDVPYTINGYSEEFWHYYNTIVYKDGVMEHRIDFNSLNNETVTLPNEAIREGYKLDGFFSGQHGGTLVINAAGYGIVTITDDIDIYAVWSEIE